MAISSKLRQFVGVSSSNSSDTNTVTIDGINYDEKTNEPTSNAVVAPEPGSEEDPSKPTEEAQVGVQKIEAITLAWSRTSMYLALLMLWFITLASDMEGTVVATIQPYIVSKFGAHSLIPIVTLVAAAIQSAVYIPMAKALDLWGRAEGLLLMLTLCIIGLVVLASSENIATYCVGQVIYSIGSGALSYSWDVLAADVTNLRNRGLAFAFTSSPAIISAFAGPKAGSRFLHLNLKTYLPKNWALARWGIGMWAIVLPVFVLPIYILLWSHQHKAEKQGIISKKKRDWSITPKSVWWALMEFDVVGVLLLASGLVIFLIPFSLVTLASRQWNSGYIIAMIVVGFFLIVCFALYESFVAPVPFLTRKYITDRTVIGACLLDMTYQVSYYCYASYFTSFLQVVYYQTVSDAGYVSSIFSPVSFVTLFIVGWAIRYTGRFKWILWICVPLYIFGTGLMIHFRQPGGNIGYIVMCEIFFSIAGGTFILCVQLAVLSVVDHQHVAAVLATLFVMGGIGDAIGSAISGAIWNNTFKPALASNLPASALPDLELIFEDISTQLSYPVGSPVRDAINKSYGHSQQIMLAAATGFMGLGFIWVAMMRDINVKNTSQTKGNVF